jgi:hypothetical protein
MIAALLLMLAVPEAPAMRIEDRIDKIMAATDGKTEATAYRVKSVADEYQILRRLGLRPAEQSLIVKGKKAYDMLEATNANGEKVELWFDISSFYGDELGF